MALGATSYTSNLIKNTASGAGKSNILPGYGDIYSAMLKLYGGYSSAADTAAHKAANAITGGSGITQADINKIYTGQSVKPPQYETNPATGYIKSIYDAPTTITGGQYPAYNALTTTTQYPTPPSLNYTMPTVPSMSWEEAQQMAEAMYKPEYESSVLRRDKMASDQRERLAQMLAARGYANPRGGKREAGEGEITQQQAIDLQDIQNQYESAKAKAARDILLNDQGRAQAMLENLIAQQNAKNQAAMQQWQTEYSAALQKDLAEKTQYNSYLNYFLELLSGNYY